MSSAVALALPSPLALTLPSMSALLSAGPMYSGETYRAASLFILSFILLFILLFFCAKTAVVTQKKARAVVENAVKSDENARKDILFFIKRKG